VSYRSRPRRGDVTPAATMAIPAMLLAAAPIWRTAPGRLSACAPIWTALPITEPGERQLPFTSAPG
ncbi:hypothetical protein C7D74_32110, partial [Klebsiella pneumoniae]